jgi:hypothetical protein
MEKIALQFPTIVELIDFSLAMTVKTYEVDRSKLAIIAAFPRSDIELAVKGYKAGIVMHSKRDDK